MILVDILIENYKQYAGEHKIEVPSGATIGIIGANGVGKTTLFEAIEWCLYNPNTIKNEQVRPRGLASHTRVAVTMVKPESGERFVVERTLKKAGVSAAIYRVEEDESETVVVQGTRQVSDYVGTRLIGLSHPAFVSTFFTRQKELSFFGHLGDTDRRREVGRLLGLNTIRAAQEAINEERKQAKAEADSLRRQYADQSEGRDFAAELETASAQITATETGLTQANAALETATATVKTAAQTRAHWQRLKDDDAGLHRDLVAREGKLHTAQERVLMRQGELARIVKREGERERLLPLAAGEPALAEAMCEQDALHERHRQQEQLRRDLERLARDRERHVHELKDHVLTVTLTERVKGWIWRDADATAPLDAIARLQATLAEIDLAAADARAEVLVACQDADTTHRTCSETYIRYRRIRSKLDEERQELLDGGDPATVMAQIDERRARAQSELSDANATANALRTERDQLDDLLRNLRQSRFEDVCPTCARPFSVGEEQLVIDSLNERRASRDREINAALARAKAAQQRLRDLDTARKSAEARLGTLHTLLGRIEASDPHLLEAQTNLRSAETALERALTDAGLKAPPVQAAVTQATSRAALFHKLHEQAGGLAQAEDWLRRGEAEQVAATAALAGLGEIRYDAAHHNEIADQLRRARDAIAALAEIEREVARRPTLEAEIAAGEADITRLAEERDVVAQKRVALGFDAAALESADAEEQAAQRAERAARDACHAAQTAHRDAILQRDLLQKEHERITRIASRADCRGREADRLDLMVREFNAFEKFVAGRYGPILAETTSQLVGQVTDGRYDRVEFDESYGIEIYDGDEEKFPLATFSGGERDAIALCARLALSRMVGGQAVSPPGFLVLDEVFGSLDRDRRARLLELLGTLAGDTDHFHQLFVISHVDDVQGSAVFDELWRVEETSEGVSQIANATRGNGVGGEFV